MRVLLADDHELVRAGIRPFLEELAPGTEVIEAESYGAALERAEEGPPLALALLDLRMPDLEDSRGLLAFREAFPTVPMVVLSGSVEVEDVFDAVRAGAAGYVPKTFGGPAMLHALRLVLAGERFFPAFAYEAVLERGLPTATSGSGRSSGGENLLDRLSMRERDILALMIEGGTNKDIGRQLSVQEITVKVHLRNIYRKLGASNRAQAVRIALESAGATGAVGPPEARRRRTPAPRMLLRSNSVCFLLMC